MRREYELTQEQYEKIDAGYQKREPHKAWCEVGDEVGFEGMSVKPIPGKGPTFFTAEEKKTEG